MRTSASPLSLFDNQILGQIELLPDAAIRDYVVGRSGPTVN